MSRRCRDRGGRGSARGLRPLLPAPGTVLGAALVLSCLVAPAGPAIPATAVPGAVFAHAESPSAPGGEAATPAAAPPSFTVESGGVRLEAAIEPLATAADEPGTESRLVEGRPVSVRLSLTDVATGEPLSGLYPAAWMDRLPAGRASEVNRCEDKVATFVGGGLLAQAEVDLNVYYVLALNEDATVSVVDPLFGFGGSKLLEMVFLDSRGEDWALSPDGRHLYVSMPSVDRVAVVDTAVWEIVARVEVGGTPVRLALQADGRYLWVATESPREGFGGPGVTVVDTVRREVAAHLPTGEGPHQVVLTGDDRRALVSDGRSGTVTVVDVARLEIVRRIAVGGEPLSLAWSETAGAAYVADLTGAVVVVDPERDEPRARIPIEPGATRIAFAPGGRHAFVVNPAEDLVQILDAATSRLVQTADVLDRPDQVVFSDTLAYVRHLGDETVYMIPLDAVGHEGAPVPVIDFPGGQRPPGGVAPPTPAPAIVQAPGATAVLVANPADGVIYYYKEGMAAPMGDFANYERRPRAVEVVDRSFEETEPGVYRSAVELRRPGAYDLAVFVDSPRVVRCFGFEVEPSEATRRRLALRRPSLELEVLAGTGPVPAGREADLAFRLRDPAGGEARADLADVTVLTMLPSGRRHRRHRAAAGEDGVYRVTWTPAEPGLHYVFVESAEAGLRGRRSPSIAVRAEEPAHAAGPGVAREADP